MVPALPEKLMQFPQNLCMGQIFQMRFKLVVALLARCGAMSGLSCLR